jgi:hypothetical protein
MQLAEVAIQAFLPSICCLDKAGEKSFRIIPHSSSSPYLAPTPPFVLMLYAYFRANLALFSSQILQRSSPSELIFS